MPNEPRLAVPQRRVDSIRFFRVYGPTISNRATPWMGWFMVYLRGSITIKLTGRGTTRELWVSESLPAAPLRRSASYALFCFPNAEVPAYLTGKMVIDFTVSWNRRTPVLSWIVPPGRTTTLS